MRAVLRYTDCMQDGRKVFLALAKMGIRVLETKKCGIHPEITVFVENREKLNKLIALLNQNCTYEVSIVKTRDSNICDLCGNYDSCPNIKKFFLGFFCK